MSDQFTSGRYAVMCITDRNYLIPTQVLIGSLLPHLDKNIDIVVMSKDVTLDDFSGSQFQGRVRKIVDFSRSPVFSKLKTLKSSVGSTHVAADAMAKLLLPFLFSEYERVLYLDVDMICCSDELNSLFERELGENLIAAVPDYKLSWHKHNTKLGLPSNKPYFNSGLILFDIPRCIGRFTEDLVLARTTAISRVNRFIDQDTLNHLYRGRVLHLEKKFNVFANVHLDYGKTLALKDAVKRKPKLLAFSGSELLKAYDERVILHFTSSSKPWKSRCGYENEWWEVCEKLALPISRPTQDLTGGTPKKRPLALRVQRSLERLSQKYLPGTNSQTLSRLDKHVAEIRSTAKVLENTANVQNVRVPVILDLAWVEFEGELTEELERVLSKYRFPTGCRIIVLPAFYNRTNILKRAWGIDFYTQESEISEGVYFKTPFLEYDLSGPSLHASWLRIENGEAPRPVPAGHWVRKHHDGSFERLSQPSFNLIEDGKRLLSSFPEHKYDNAIAALFQR